MTQNAQGQDKFALIGHLGTHFDVMNKVFPLEYTELTGFVFDESKIKDRDIEVTDIDITKVSEKMFVAFCSSHIENTGYGTYEYHHDHPQLSNELIDTLLDRNVAIIGVDFPGIRRSKEHTAKDQYCADRGTFIVENLCNLESLIDKEITGNTFPMNYAELTGLPCRVIAKVK